MPADTHPLCSQTGVYSEGLAASMQKRRECFWHDSVTAAPAVYAESA